MFDKSQRALRPALGVLLAAGLVGACAADEAPIKQQKLVSVPEDVATTAPAVVPTTAPPVATKAPVVVAPLVAKTTAPATKAPAPVARTKAPAPPPADSVDRDYGTCKEAKANGKGPYYQGRDPEYDYYRDADDDGVVCE